MNARLIALPLCAALGLLLLLAQAPWAQEKGKPGEKPDITGLIDGPDDLTPELLRTFRLHAYSAKRLNEESYFPAECRHEIDEDGHFKVFGLKEKSKLIFELDGWAGACVYENSPRRRVVVGLSPASRVSISLAFEDMPAREVACNVICDVGSAGKAYIRPVADRSSVTLSEKPYKWPFQLPEGKHSLSCYWADDLMAFHPVAQDLEAKNGTPINVVIPCRACASLTLVETEGRTLPHSAITLKAGTQAQTLNLYSGGTGVLNCNRLTKGEYTLSINAPGYEPWSTSVTLEPSKRTEVKFALKAIAESAMKGRVTDSEGKPVGGARITLAYNDEGCLTDADGNFEYPEPNRRGPNRVVSVTADGYEFGVATVQPDGTYLAKLERSTMIFGTVKGVEGMELTYEVLPCDDAGKVDYKQSYGQEGQIRADGTYRVTLRRVIPNKRARVWPKTVAILVDLGGTRQTFTVEGIGPDTWIQKDFELAAGSTVSGKVKGADGKPLAGLEMWLKHPRLSNPYKATTDADGAYTFKNLGAETFTLEFAKGATAWAGTQKQLRVKAGTNVVQDYDFTGTSTILVKATVSKRPVNMATLHPSKGPGELAMAYTPENTVLNGPPELKFCGVKPGTYRIELEPAMPTHPSVEIVVVAGKPEYRVEGDFGPKRVWGKLTIPAGVDAASSEPWRVVMLEAPGKDKPEAPIAKDGSFEFKELSAGTYRAIAWIPGHSSDAVEFQLVGDYELKFELKPAAVVVIKPINWTSPADKQAVNLTFREDVKSGAKGLRLFMQGIVLQKDKTTLAFSSLPQGSYTLEISYPAGRDQGPIDYFSIPKIQLEAQGGKQFVAEIEVRACATIELVDAQNKVTTTSVTLTDADGKNVGLFIGAFGKGAERKVRYSELPAGEIKLVVKAKGYKEYSTKVKTEIGKAAQVTVTLEKE